MSNTPSPDLAELFHERAGILEFDAGMSRPKAEYEAALELQRLYGNDNLPVEIRDIGNAAFLILKHGTENKKVD